MNIEAEIHRLFSSISILERRKEEIHLEPQRKKIIILAGPTCCGKSAIGLMLAEALGGEIISADSMQVYRGMDIGTAKASKKEQQRIPHHLIDIRDVTDGFNVVDFYCEARHQCLKIHERESIPIVVGGSGFYIHSLIYGPPGGPPSVPELRKSLEDSLDVVGSVVLFERLQELDPEYAATISPHDRQKIVRALEIITLSGKKVSKNIWKGRKPLEDYDCRCWFLHRPRSTLYHRIEKRCEKMVEAGFLEEVARLEQDGIRKNFSTAHAIGYRQALEYLDVGESRDGYKEFMENFKKASRHYAKRQLTWWRQQEHNFRWLDLDLHDPETVVDIISRDFDILI